MARRVACLVAVGLLFGVGFARMQARQSPVSQNANQQGAAVLRGRVVAADTGAPLRHAHVQPAPGNQAVPSVLTDGEGRFAISLPLAGQSRLSVTKPGYLPTTIVSSQTAEEIGVRMAKAGAISGRITNRAGDPVIGMAVTAELATDPQHKAIGTSQTDDLGDYRVGGLAAGSYLVTVTTVSPLVGPQGELVTVGDLRLMVNGQNVASDDIRRRAGAFYPGVETLADALAITVAPGEERTAIDFPAPLYPPVDVFGELRAPAAPRGGVPSGFTGGIRGRVVAADGRPLPQALVRLQSDDYPSLIPPAIADEDGQYEFQKLSAGAFRVIATKAGFVTMEYGRRRPSDSGEPIELRQGETRARVDIALPRSGALVGHVVDEDGEPIEGATVRLLQAQYRDGRRRLVSSGGQGSHRTDDRGAYRIYGVLPGEYIVSANVGQVVLGQPIADVSGYTTSYFPGTTNPGAARRIAVDLAEEVTGLDFPLARAPTARIAGTILDAEGNPVSGGLILTPSRRSGTLATDPLGARTFPDGRFEFPNVAPGEYVIQVSRGRRDPYAEGESLVQFVTANGTDVTGMMLRLSRGSTLSGHLTYDGMPDAQLYSALNLQAVPVDADLTPQNLGSPASARIRPDGSFEMTGLSGPRVLRLTEARKGWSLKAVYLNGRDVTDTPLPFGTTEQSIDSVEVVLTSRVPVVTGHALDARGRAVRGATVVVFSTSREHWSATSRFLGVSDPTDKDGSFAIGNLPPGDFYAVAVTSLSPGEWRDPDLLDALVPSATHLSLSEGDMVGAELRVVAR